MPGCRRLLLASASVFLSLLTGLAQESPRLQWAAVPYDPNEPVTGGIKALTNPKERSAALELLDRARQNYTLYGPHQPAFNLKVSFTSTGQSQYEGQGGMEETWVGHGERWTAKIGSTQVLRVIYNGQFWSDNPSAPVPMRVQMVRDALLWPVINPRPRVMLRAAAAIIQGKSAMCVLTSGSMGTTEQPRHWVEQEYCVDPETGNMLVVSEAPGHFVYYDYTSMTNFQGHDIANDISIFEGGTRILRIHVDSLTDASGVAPESLRPTPDMMAKGPSFGLSFPMKFPIRVPPAAGTQATSIQPVFVHATVDRDGHVVEAETLQNVDSQLAQRAIETVKNFERGKRRAQGEEFVNVQFLVGNKQLAAAQ